MRPRTTDIHLVTRLCKCYNIMNRRCLILNLSCHRRTVKRRTPLLLVSEAGMVVSKLVGVFRAHVFEVVVVFATFSLLVVAVDEDETARGNKEHREGTSQI
jgi:hypothetical protein